VAGRAKKELAESEVAKGEGGRKGEMVILSYLNHKLMSGARGHGF